MTNPINKIEPYQLDTTATYTVAGITATATANLGAAGNVTITGGSSNQVLAATGTGTTAWIDIPSPFLLMGA